jgi:serine/threonine protein kinase
VYLTQYGDPQPRNAAIKLVLADTPDADPAANWQRAEQLSHPNLLGLLRTGTWQVNQLSLGYAVTEYADESLAAVLAERPLSPLEVREMLKPLLDAVAYIHAEGLVHGRLKPANIMAMGDDLKLSVDGVSLVGEPGAAPAVPGPYDPPEIHERGCSPMGDVWSIGMTLVEALTRRLPVLSGPKQELVLPSGVPPEFLPMVRACLRPDPRRRVLIDEILALYGQEEPKAVEEPVPEPPAAPRKWLSLALVGASAVALAGILAGPRLLRRPAASAQAQQSVVVPASTPVAAPPEAAPAVEPAPAAAASTPDTTPPPPRRHESSVDAPAGEVVHQVLPDVPEYARRTIRGKVKIQVRAVVDGAGHVTDANVESQNSQYFAKLSLQAARQWEFAPAAGDWVLRFEFTPAGITVHPSRVAR